MNCFDRNGRAAGVQKWVCLFEASIVILPVLSLDLTWRAGSLSLPLSQRRPLDGTLHRRGRRRHVLDVPLRAATRESESCSRPLDEARVPLDLAVLKGGRLEAAELVLPEGEGGEADNDDEHRDGICAGKERTMGRWVSEGNV